MLRHAYTVVAEAPNKSRNDQTANVLQRGCHEKVKDFGDGQYRVRIKFVLAFSLYDDLGLSEA